MIELANSILDDFDKRLERGDEMIPVGLFDQLHAVLDTLETQQPEPKAEDLLRIRDRVKALREKLGV